MLNETKIKNALNRLSELLGETNESRTLLLVGGAALQLLGYTHKTVTTDIDNLLPMDDLLKNLVLKIAKEMDLNENWLNSNSSSFARKNIDYFLNAQTVISSNSLTVQIVSINIFIELKVRAHLDRGFDLEDILALHPTKEQLNSLRDTLLKEGNHLPHVIEEDFREIFKGLGYEN
ncbi:MAG: DUF6036 family nucleotidyltransferase [Bacteriovorax sp.]|nr:DUF6036 family nucleotidyltransferase [Bacteriovorax sp.]